MSTNTFGTKARVAFAVTGLGLMGILSGCSAAAVAEDAATTAGSSSTDSSSDSSSDSTSSDSTSSDSTSTDSSTASGSDYTDGTYSTTATYQSPGGTESLGVSITIADDTVTAVTVTNEAVSSNGKQYQARFIAAISSAVVGKDLSTLSVSRVAGASLTSGGFDNALDSIRSEAAV